MRHVMDRETHVTIFFLIAQEKTNFQTDVNATNLLNLTLKKYYDAHQRTEDIAPGASASYFSTCQRQWLLASD